MLVLVLNSGSSSLKFQLIETGAEQIAANSDRALVHGSVERIGSDAARMRYEVEGQPREEKTSRVATPEDAIRIAFEHLSASAQREGSPFAMDAIEAVGHRIVHGGETFHKSAIINAKTLREIESVSALAPLHNPHNLKGYYVSRELLSKAKQAAVFDTAFHLTLPRKAFLYGIPYEFYERDKVRKYGFHGTSFRYVSWRYALLLGTTADTLKLVACHLGNGCSACAIDHGKSVDTSMGFTPMDGLLMGTRPGEIDPGAVLFLAGRGGGGVQETETMLNHRAGLSGIAGASDMRDLLARRDAGDERARDAIDVFCYRVAQFIASYDMVLNGADAILFTGGIGENAAPIREQICAELRGMGVRSDPVRDGAAKGSDACISSPESKVPVWVIRTNEELLIARDTFVCATGASTP